MNEQTCCIDSVTEGLPPSLIALRSTRRSGQAWFQTSLLLPVRVTEERQTKTQNSLTQPRNSHTRFTQTETCSEVLL